MGGLGAIGLSCGLKKNFIGCYWDLQHSLTSYYEPIVVAVPLKKNPSVFSG